MKLFTLKISPLLIVLMALLVPIAHIGFLAMANAGHMKLLSEKELIAAYLEYEAQAARPIYYLNYMPASATYYSQREAVKLTGAASGRPQQAFWLAVHKKEGEAPAWECTLHLQPKQGIFDLYLCQD